MLRELGADPVIDADTVVHELYATSRPLQEAIAAAFGADVRRPDGSIDRRVLGARVFGDPDRLRRLEALVHPATRQAVSARLEAAPDGSLAVVDAVKLLQGGLAELCTERWWVTADPAVQLRRLTRNRKFTQAEAEQRLAAQPRLNDWRYLIDRVIDNSGTRDETRRQVEGAWRQLQRQSSTQA